MPLLDILKHLAIVWIIGVLLVAFLSGIRDHKKERYQIDKERILIESLGWPVVGIVVFTIVTIALLHMAGLRLGKKLLGGHHEKRTNND